MIQKPKGTYDLYKDEARLFKYLESILTNLMETYNYDYIRTPLFESTNLFARGVGEGTDIVNKEMYEFTDKGNRSMTLRPEGTAGVVRSYIENKMYADEAISKNWYLGSMYRYERPQSGRFREFYQFGVEVFNAADANIDAEVISIPVNFYKILGLKGIKVKINTLGDSESRESYKEKLLTHFKPHLDELCSDCKKRYETNPLRLLDCKVDSEKECIKNAPLMSDSLNDVSIKHFEDLKKYLSAMDIDYEVDQTLVRGLDYYTHTVFEVEANIEGFGSQNVLCGGGRYDKLVSTIGGPDIKGVGFALGMERLVAAIKSENIELDYTKLVDVYVVALNDEAKVEALALTQALRLNGFITDTDYMNKSLKGNFKYSEKIGSKFVILIGEEEIKNNTLTIKDNTTKEQHSVKTIEVIDLLDKLMDTHDHGCCGRHDDCACGGNCNH